MYNFDHLEKEHAALPCYPLSELNLEVNANRKY